MNDEIRPEYDLGHLPNGGVCGKYAKRYHAGTNLVLLEPDTRTAFRRELLREGVETMLNEDAGGAYIVLHVRARAGVRATDAPPRRGHGKAMSRPPGKCERSQLI